MGEKIRAIKGNIRNWTWSVFPTFKLEKEEALELINYIDDHERKDRLLEHVITDLSKYKGAMVEVDKVIEALEIVRG